MNDGEGALALIRVDVLWTARDAEHHDFQPGEAAAVFDILRATTTMTAALAAGARGIIPVTDPEAALRLRETLQPAPLLGGEERMTRRPGFDLGNSPLEYTPDVVRGRVIALCTTNGTRAAAAAVRGGCRHLFAASLLNRTATARALLRGTEAGTDAAAGAAGARRGGWDEPRAITLICAGTHGRFSLDDVIGAGAVVEALQALARNDPRREGGLSLSDAALAALNLWRQARESVAAALAGCHHGRLLARAGFEADIEFASRVDVFDFAVQWQPHEITSEGGGRGQATGPQDADTVKSGSPAHPFDTGGFDTGGFVATYFPGN